MGYEVIIIVWAIALMTLVALGETLKGIEKREKEERAIYMDRYNVFGVDYESNMRGVQDCKDRYDDYFSPERKSKRLRIKRLIGLGMLLVAIVAMAILIPLMTE